MKCPHCLVEINEDFRDIELGSDLEGNWYANVMKCPNGECKKLIVRLELYDNRVKRTESMYFVRPISTTRPLAPSEVDIHIANDYNESCAVLSLSRKASAALSRRCLQNLLREKAGVVKKDLSKEIQEIIDSNTLPSYLSESIDAIRNIGNYAAHPLKSSTSGEIIDVEPGEAEWALDVLEQLFDFYYVQPAKLAAKRLDLDAKLASIGKPPMK